MILSFDITRWRKSTWGVSFRCKTTWWISVPVFCLLINIFPWQSQAGLGQAPARQAALGAGLSISTPATTVNKVTCNDDTNMSTKVTITITIAFLVDKVTENTFNKFYHYHCCHDHHDHQGLVIIVMISNHCYQVCASGLKAMSLAASSLALGHRFCFLSISVFSFFGTFF